MTNEEDDEDEVHHSIEDVVSKRTHHSVSVCLLLAVTVSALFTKDLRKIFALVGCFSEALLNFILPGWFLLLT